MLQDDLKKQEVRGHFLQKSLNARKLIPCVPRRKFDTLTRIKPRSSRAKEEFPLLNNRDVLKLGKPLGRTLGKRVAVLFSGGPAAGGHNVIVGLHERLKGNTLLGVKNGPEGLLNGEMFVIKSTKHIVNTGGFDFLGTGRKKIKSYEELKQVRKVCLKRRINAIVIIGGDDSNTNATILAEFLHTDNIQVIGIPKTMDGDLQLDKYLPIPFGFDTATKIYSSLVGNLCKDTASSKKYWHFVRLMGRDASHVALEVALQTKVTHTIISEEVREKKQSLHSVVDEICRIIMERSRAGKDHGVILIPEGLLGFIPELHSMLRHTSVILKEKQRMFKHKSLKRRRIYLSRKLSNKDRALYVSLPENVQEMLTLNRDSHGNIKVSQIPTEELIVELAKTKLARKGYSLQSVLHFYGYEGRCGPPSLFDAQLGYNLGLAAGNLILSGFTGYMACISDFNKKGRAYAVPLAALVDVEDREGEKIWVIRKKIVESKDPAFRYFKSRRRAWQKGGCFTNPGPRQFIGKAQIPILVALNSKYGSLEWK